MTKAELFATYPEGADDRRMRKHLWTPPGGGESLADGVLRRAQAFVALARGELDTGHAVVAITHHTTILALRAVLEDRPITQIVEQARAGKTPPRWRPALRADHLRAVHQHRRERPSTVMDEASDVVFFNGPVQNGEFTFASHPGKAVGIRIAAALNAISGNRPTPHLWNTVMLAGDLRYRAYAAGHPGPLSRPDFEHAAIAAKYPPGRHPAVVTDTADQAGAVLTAEDFSAHARRQPAHLRQIAGNVPPRLIGVTYPRPRDQPGADRT